MPFVAIGFGKLVLGVAVGAGEAERVQAFSINTNNIRINKTGFLLIFFFSSMRQAGNLHNE